MTNDIIQIAATPETEDAIGLVYALKEDNSIWMLPLNRDTRGWIINDWVKLPEIPE